MLGCLLVSKGNLRNTSKSKIATKYMLYWFKKIKNNEYFPIDDERAAWRMLSRPDFRPNFEYVGRSDGSTYQKIIRESGLRKLNAKEHAEIVSSGIQDEPRREVSLRAFDEELKVALEKNDRTPPRNFNFTDEKDEPLTDPMLVGFLKKMG